LNEAPHHRHVNTLAARYADAHASEHVTLRCPYHALTNGEPHTAHAPVRQARHTRSTLLVWENDSAHRSHRFMMHCTSWSAWEDLD
jgi:hypothetical protein